MSKEKLSIGELKREYDYKFNPDENYLDGMPDLQNSEFNDIPIEFVGIQGFKLPVRLKTRSGEVQDVIANITGTVSLEAEKRGINMSRILRTFYKSKDQIFSIDELEQVLKNYKKDLDTFDAHIMMNFEYHIWQPALRTKLEDGKPAGGYQFYNVTFDVNMDKTGEFKKIMWLDFVYSSACPCSTELSIYAGKTRGVYGIPHSQRSVARIGVDFDEFLWIEDLIEMCQESLKTETLVFCKRQDEQAFAELNGANVKFVEDAIRILAHALNEDQRIKDYKVICSHLESLHDHNACAVITKGKKDSVFSHHVPLEVFKDMAAIHS